MIYKLIKTGFTEGSSSGADPGFDRGGGAQIVTGLKLPFWGLSFVEFWCWGLIFGGQGGGPGPPGPPPWICPCSYYTTIISAFDAFSIVYFVLNGVNDSAACFIRGAIWLEGYRYMLYRRNMVADDSM